MMGMYRYPEELPGVMKLLNDYITESGNNRNFGKTSGKEQTGVDFTHTQEKDAKYKKNTNRKGEYHCLHYGKKYNWASNCPNLEEEQKGQLHNNVGTVKDNVHE